MTSAPVVLDVGGFFKPSHKYANSVAQVLDCLDYDDSTGDVEWGLHFQIFYDVDFEGAYLMVSNYIATEQMSGQCEPVSWNDAKMLIDILEEGKNWMLVTDSQGFVGAHCITNRTEAVDNFRAIEKEYGEWASTNP